MHQHEKHFMQIIFDSAASWVLFNKNTDKIHFKNSPVIRISTLAICLVIISISAELDKC